MESIFSNFFLVNSACYLGIFIWIFSLRSGFLPLWIWFSLGTVLFFFVWMFGISSLRSRVRCGYPNEDFRLAVGIMAEIAGALCGIKFWNSLGWPFGAGAFFFGFFLGPAGLLAPDLGVIGLIRDHMVKIPCPVCQRILRKGYSERETYNGGGPGGGWDVITSWHCSHCGNYFDEEMDGIHKKPQLDENERKILREKEEARGREIAEHNLRFQKNVSEMLKNGCPRCGADGSFLRVIQKEIGEKSYVICKKCARSFDQNDVSRPLAPEESHKKEQV